jgi:D-arabinose 1-dehydrogenase-like Zn-dependent alcohol dehydrogenase
MAGKMHVAVVEHFGKPLVQQEWEIPSPGSGQILVKRPVACATRTSTPRPEIGR